MRRFSNSDEINATVSLSIERDGTARIQGTVVVHRFNFGQSSGVFKAMQGTSASTSCSDTDQNGVGGLLSFAATFTNVRTGEPIRVEFVSSEDIDEPGIYEGRLSVGEEVFPALVRVPRTTILYFAENRT